MNDQMTNREEFVEINLKRLLDALMSKAWVTILVAVLVAAISLCGTLLLITPKYESSAMFYVNNSDISVGGATLSLTNSDLTASRGLVDTYIVILETRETLVDVIDYAGVSYDYETLQKMIQAESVDETQVFKVTVTGTDPVETEQIASAIAYILPKRISGIVEGTSAKVVDSAVIPTAPSSPSYTVNTLVGFALGFLLSAAAIVLRELFDITIRSEEDIRQVCKYPVLVSVPDMNAGGKGGYYSADKKKSASGSGSQKAPTIGGDISFAAAEAYKLLRTKLQYSFAGEENTCRVIGISSALTGEGKSLTATNLAYTLSQLDKKVLLIDCDMRRPTLSIKLPVNKKPGLSGYLSGQVRMENLMQPCGIPGEEDAFWVITSGQNPPNPMELLNSQRMTKMLQQLRASFDYIILDLPPVGEVGDALVAAKETDGVLLIARQNYGNRVDLSTAVRQFEFVGCRLLGITINGAGEEGSGYSRKYYKRYGKYKYESKYERSYVAAHSKAKRAEKGDA